MENACVYERLLNFSVLVKGGHVSPRWRQGGKTFVYAAGPSLARRFVEVDPVSGEQQPFFDDCRLRAALAQVLGQQPMTGTPFEEFSFVDEERAIRFEIAGRTFDLRLADYLLTELSSSAALRWSRLRAKKTSHFHPATRPDSYEIPSPAGDLWVRVENYNLWVRDIVDNRSRRITSDGVDRYGWGLGPAWTPTSHTWSPDGQFLAAMKVDTRRVHHMPVVHWLGYQVEVDYHVFPPAGGILPHQELFFIDIYSGQLVSCNLGDEPTYIRLVGWMPGGQELMFFWLSRNGKRVELRSASRKTGLTRVLWTDHADTFVVSTMEFLYNAMPNFAMLSDCRFVVSSARTGWNHIYLYGPAPEPTACAELLMQLTDGDFPVSRIVGVDEKSHTVYFTAQCDPQRVYDIHLMSVGLDGTGLRQLTTATGRHDVQMAPSYEYFLDTHSTIDRAPVTELRSSDGGSAVIIERADISELVEIGWRAPEEVMTEAEDGNTNLYGIIHKPWNFEPRKKYPVIEYIYAGPQTTVVPHTFTPPAEDLNVFAAALAQLGFLVVSIDARGTPGRSKAFQDVIYGNWGRHEIADHVAALRNLAATRPYMDLTRVGIFGHSYGGYYATRAMLQAPDFYKVGVALAPVAHLNSNAALATENYFGGAPQEVPELYAYANNLPLADRLRGKLLIVHPTSDCNAPFAHAVQLIDAFNKAGKRYDFNIFPDEDHLFRASDALEQQRLYRTIIRDYFLAHLPPTDSARSADAA